MRQNVAHTLRDVQNVLVPVASKVRQKHENPSGRLSLSFLGGLFPFTAQFPALQICISEKK